MRPALRLTAAVLCEAADTGMHWMNVALGPLANLLVELRALTPVVILSRGL